MAQRSPSVYLLELSLSLILALKSLFKLLASSIRCLRLYQLASCTWSNSSLFSFMFSCLKFNLVHKLFGSFTSFQESRNMFWLGKDNNYHKHYGFYISWLCSIEKCNENQDDKWVLKNLKLIRRITLSHPAWAKYRACSSACQSKLWAKNLVVQLILLCNMIFLLPPMVQYRRGTG